MRMHMWHVMIMLLRMHACVYMGLVRRGAWHAHRCSGSAREAGCIWLAGSAVSWVVARAQEGRSEGEATMESQVRAERRVAAAAEEASSEAYQGEVMAVVATRALGTAVVVGWAASMVAAATATEVAAAVAVELAARLVKGVARWAEWVGHRGS